MRRAIDREEHKAAPVNAVFGPVDAYTTSTHVGELPLVVSSKHKSLIPAQRDDKTGSNQGGPWQMPETSGEKWPGTKKKKSLFNKLFSKCKQ